MKSTPTTKMKNRLSDATMAMATVEALLSLANRGCPPDDIDLASRIAKCQRNAECLTATLCEISGDLCDLRRESRIPEEQTNA
jgi:hypothetical protein